MSHGSRWLYNVSVVDLVLETCFTETKVPKDQNLRFRNYIGNYANVQAKSENQ